MIATRDDPLPAGRCLESVYFWVPEEGGKPIEFTPEDIRKHCTWTDNNSTPIIVYEWHKVVPHGIYIDNEHDGTLRFVDYKPLFPYWMVKKVMVCETENEKGLPPVLLFTEHYRVRKFTTGEISESDLRRPLVFRGAHLNPPTHGFAKHKYPHNEGSIIFEVPDKEDMEKIDMKTISKNK